MAAAARIPDGGDVVDIDAEAQAIHVRCCSSETFVNPSRWFRETKKSSWTGRIPVRLRQGFEGSGALCLIRRSFCEGGPPMATRSQWASLRAHAPASKSRCSERAPASRRIDGQVFMGRRDKPGDDARFFDF
jgi:hypothetical protein